MKIFTPVELKTFYTRIVKRLQETLGYIFQDEKLLHEALSHPSLSSEQRPAPPDNQRLEYLGDAVLELIISNYLYHRFRESQEGVMTKLRASVVSRNALAKVALRLDMGAALMMSSGEESSGGRARTSNLADALEALIGALYLDAGWESAAEIILAFFSPELEALDPTAAQISNSKGRLQEILQKFEPESPVYTILEESGPPHDRTFLAQVTWGGKILGNGSGASKKMAETEAAGAALEAESWK